MPATITSSSVPPDIDVVLMGFPDESVLNARFEEAIRYIIAGCGRFMDLSRLDGVTIGFDYDEALASVCLGYESSVAKTYTNTGDLIGVAKVLRVFRNNQVKAHIVYNAGVLRALADPQSVVFPSTLNLIAHELGHVGALGWFEKHSPGIMLKPFDGDWLRWQIMDAAHTCWDEYAACRLAAVFPSQDVEANYLDISIRQSANVFATAHESIKSYRTHADIGRVILDASRPVCNAFKFIAYYLGNYDGSHQDGGEFNDGSFNELSDFVEAFHLALRDAWETRLAWRGFSGLEGVFEVLIDALHAAGMHITFEVREGVEASRVFFPFSPQTLPGGEAEYKWMKDAGLI